MSGNDLHRGTPRLALGAVFLLGILGAAAWGTGLLGAGVGFNGTTYEPPALAADFTLTDHEGRTVSLADFRGQGVLLFFGFTHCPDICPLTLSRLSRILADLDADTADVRVLLVTVDPARDTPAVLADYVARFGPHVRGLTGDSASIAGVLAAYAAYAQHHTDPAGHHQVSHSTAVFGIDRAGQIRVLLPMEQGEAIVAADIRALLRS